MNRRQFLSTILGAIGGVVLAPSIKAANKPKMVLGGGDVARFSVGGAAYLGTLKTPVAGGKDIRLRSDEQLESALNLISKHPSVTEFEVHNSTRDVNETPGGFEDNRIISQTITITIDRPSPRGNS